MAIYGSPTVGRLGLVEEVSSANQAALGLVANPRTSTTEHLWFVLRDLRDYLNQVAQGAAQQNVSKTKVVNAPVILPPVDLIRRFTMEAGPPWRLSHRVARATHVISEIRDMLLPKLVTGQIDVSKLDLDALVEAAG
jgi:type I restriction enzyme, S subunit